MSIEERIEVLERETRSLRRRLARVRAVGAAMALAIVATLIVGAAPPGVQEVVRARVIQIVSSDGSRNLIELRTTNDEKGRITVADGLGYPIAEIGPGAYGGGALALYGEEGYHIASLERTPFGEGMVRTYDGHGFLLVSLDSSTVGAERGSGAITLFDAARLPAYRWPIQYALEQTPQCTPDHIAF